MAKCPLCNKRLEEVEYIDDLGDIYWCKKCHVSFYEDEGELSTYEPLSEDEAEDIYLSSGMDEDYDFRS